MPDFGIAGPSFGLRDVKVAQHNGDGTWDTAVDVPSVQLLSVNVQTTNAELPGDDTITDQHSKAIAAQVQLRFGSVSQAVLEALTGQPILSTGTTPNIKRVLRFRAKNFPYFGLCGKAEPTQGSGSKVTFVPKIKIVEGFEARYEYGAYAIPDLTCRALPDDLYEPGGENEVQTLTITGTPTGGTFTLTFRGQATANIAYNAAAAAVQSALELLSTIGTGNVAVAGSALPGGTQTITFQGDLANTPLPLITANSAGLTGGTTPTAGVVETTNGVAVYPVIFDDIEYEWDQPALVPPA